MQPAAAPPGASALGWQALAPALQRVSPPSNATGTDAVNAVLQGYCRPVHSQVCLWLE